MMTRRTHEQYIEMELEAGQSNFVCPVCFLPIDIEDESRLINEYSVECKNGCMIPYDDGQEKDDFCIFDACVVLRPGYKKLAENPAIAPEMHWYHISNNSPSEMEFNSRKDMHVGSLETVKYYRDTLDCWRNNVRDYYVYELRMKNVAIEKDLLCDKNYWELQNNALENDNVYGYAYVNRWEAPGSISILARRDIFEIVNITENALPTEIGV